MPARTPDVAPPGYPAELEADVVLADGLVAELRPIVPADAPGLLRFAAKLSDETRYLRFFSYRKSLTERELAHLVTVDYTDRLALVALADGEIVAVARYERLAPGGDEAEVAFTVRDDQQGRGLATVMLEHLASAARDRGITCFVAETLADNHKMLGVFRNAGFEERASYESGVIRVRMLLEAGPGYLEGVEDRDRVAAVASMRRLLAPESVAVVGASRTPGTVGHELVANLHEGGFGGGLYPIHPHAAEISGIRAYPSIGAVPEPVDLAVIAVAARLVPDVVEECGRAGVGGVVIVSTGFSESGADGALLERQVVEVARRHGMRVVGPSSMGIVNPTPGVSMNATFSPVRPEAGHVAFCSQSGGLGVAILHEAERRGIGISGFVSMGNKADVSSNDLIRYFDADGETEVILMHVESFGNPRHFRQIARQVARRRPIVSVKSRRWSPHPRPRAVAPAPGDSGASVLPDAAVDALFRQAGVIRVDTLEELFDVAEVLDTQPLPAGGNVAILANAGGPSVLAADACEGYGLALADLSPETTARLAAALTPGAVVANPVDCVAWATAAEYGTALEILLADEAVDAVIVIFTPALAVDADDVASVVAEVSSRGEKPVVANFLAAGRPREVLRGGPRAVPSFAYPESAARALAHITPYARWRREPEERPAAIGGVDRQAVSDAVERALSDEPLGRWLEPGESASLLAAYGIRLDLGPGGVLTGETAGVLPGEAAGGPAGGLPGEVELTIGVVEDESFGPIVFAGLAAIAGIGGIGGQEADLLGERALSLVPVTTRDALGMIGRLRSAPLLVGDGSAPPVDLDLLAGLICRVAAFAEDVPALAELRLEPVWCSASRCRVTAAALRLQPPAREPALRRRRLR